MEQRYFKLGCAKNVVLSDHLLFKSKKESPANPLVYWTFWRRVRDSNPRAIARKLISSQPRYDHFDTSPYMIKLKVSLIFVCYRTGLPVMSCCGSPKFVVRQPAHQISTAATPFCSLHLPLAALANVPVGSALCHKYHILS